MSDTKNDTGWIDSGKGYSFRSFSIPKFKPFGLEDLKNTWCMSIPDGKGNVVNSGGHWVDGKMVEEWRETSPDPFRGIVRK